MTPKQEKAHNLYFQSGATQAQIAKEVGVTSKTVSLWVNEGKWQLLREMTQKAPVIMIEEMYNELAEINHTIRQRQPGQRFATVREAEVRRKLLASIRYIKEQQSTGAHIEVLMNFTHFVRQHAPHLAVEVVQLADHYLKGELKITQPHHFTPYNLHENTTAQRGKSAAKKVTIPSPDNLK